MPCFYVFSRHVTDDLLMLARPKPRTYLQKIGELIS